MQDEQRKLRQLEAAIRLRAMQREKAELEHNRSRRAVVQAEHLLSEEQARYRRVQACFEALGRSGAVLDPALHEQRLLAQTGAFFRLESQHRAVDQAQQLSQTAMAQLLHCKVNEDLVGKAQARVRALLGHALREQETIDIFDAQQAQGAGYGR